MSPVVGWALAAAAVVVGWLGYGWRGMVLAISVVVFWLLLQFSRSLRALREAAKRPVGTVAGAVMLDARLRRGLRLADVIKMTGSLGLKLGDEPERFAWRDAGGDSVEVEFARDGRVTAWQLVRGGSP